MSSSTKSGTPSVLATIWSNTSTGSALPPVTRSTIASGLPPPKAIERKRGRMRAPAQGAANSGRQVTTKSARRFGSRSTSRPNRSSDVGSIQCASSSAIKTGASFASPSISEISAAIVLSSVRPGPFPTGGRSVERDREQGREEWRDVPRLQSRTGDHRLQLVEPRGVQLAAGKTRRVPYLARDRKEGVVDVVRRALVAHRHMRLVADPLGQCRLDTRFADAGLPRDQHDLAFACLRLVPAPQQERQFLLPADQSCDAPPMQRFKTVFGRAFSDDLPDGDRFGKAGERDRPALFALKEFPDQLPKSSP